MAPRLGRARRRMLPALGAILAIAPGAAGCGGGEEEQRGTEPAAPGAVEARDFSFAPAAIEVAPGTEVRWTNTGEQIHNVRGPGFFSEAIAAGESFAHRFDRPGRYRYVCTLHPATMRGMIAVARGERLR